MRFRDQTGLLAVGGIIDGDGSEVSPPLLHLDLNQRMIKLGQAQDYSTVNRYPFSNCNWKILFSISQTPQSRRSDVLIR